MKLFSMPVSYVYQPVTLATKPWYAERYSTGLKEGRKRVPYKDQSKNVIGMTDWWEKSRWVFFENYKTTTFRSPNHDRQSRERARYREAAAQHRQAISAHETRNAGISGSYVVRIDLTQDP